ncbi:insecticidal delta-endotoxin Cry8Ea1 family protein [Bacillus toyonensis]|uniref:insecticidal delta-endotoxin Cry8Ea1 family protein n=1 Tax=Bacillus toyonensis TaxID=155322 RepID=UPI003D2228C9
MNQYYRNNEMEILDPGIRHSQYPYAQNQRADLQSMNYKEWLLMCERNDSLRPGTLASTKDIVTTSIDIVGTILGFIPIVGGPIAAGVSIINSIIKILWPEPENPSDPIDVNKIWVQFMEKVEQLIDQAIDKAVFDAAIGKLNGLKRSLNLYQNSFSLWTTDQTDLELQEDLRTNFTAARHELVTTIEQFKYAGQEVNLLTVFAQAADLHLLLLREGIMYGEQWGFDERTVQEFYSNAYDEGLRDLLPIYTDHCNKWYNEGLTITYNLTPDLSNTERYPWAADRSSGNIEALTQLEGWNLFNDWRRDVTIMALDLVAIWPTYDLAYYDNSAYGVQTELTRPLYSQATGTCWLTLTRDQYEQGIVRPPHLATWLNFIQFHLNPGPYPDASDSYRHYRGIQMEYYLSGQDYTTYMSPLIGSTSTSGKKILVESKYNNDIFQVNSKHNDAVYTMDFSRNSGDTQTVGYLRDPNYSTLSWPSETSSSNYGHRMTWISGPVSSSTIPAFSTEWVHISSSPFNTFAESTVENPIITQISAVKADSLTGGAYVTKGNGTTGGDLITLPANAKFTIRLTGTPYTPYQVRLRYTCPSGGDLLLSRDSNMGGTWYNDTYFSMVLPATPSSGELTYNSFGYVTAPQNLGPTASIDWKMQFSNSGVSLITIDKIEFIPILGNTAEYEAKQNLKKARKAVNSLFTDDTKTTLRLDVTDYDVDQAANQVDCMSDDMFLKEKMVLLDQVKQAKRLSQAKNLLHYGDFESSDWSSENGWTVSNNVSIQADPPISRGRYLNMPGARIIDFSNRLYPTYAYQKIDESKLKPYTRYWIRGFVESSKALELLVTRYGKDIHTEMNVSSNPGIRTLEHCGAKQVSLPISSDPCQNIYATSAYTRNESISNNRLCEDKHHFVFHIDVGELDLRANPGIQFGLKISSPEGMAQLDNLEVVEAQPLTSEALARVKKREQKWKREREQKCMETERAVTSARQAVDSLFTSTQKNRLKATTNKQSIELAEAKVKAIPYVHNSEFEDLPGMSDLIFQALQSDIMTAFNLYGRRNVIRNGDFSGGLSNWLVTDGADIQERDGRPHVLVISQWDANVSQDVCVQPEHGYVLRVTARKEGAGKGYVTISDCTAENTETVTFTSDEMVMTERPPVAPTSSACDRLHDTQNYETIYNEKNMNNGYAESFGMTSCSCGSYGANTCSCGMSKGNMQQSYTATQRIPNRNPQYSSMYLTKTIEMFPETNRIRIEVGETQGTFLIDSIELICMED